MPPRRRPSRVPARAPRGPSARLVAAEHALQAHRRIIAALHHIAALALRERPLAAVLQEVVAEVSAATSFPMVAIEFYDPANQCMEFAAATGIPSPPGQDRLRVPVDQTLSGLVARSGQAIVEVRAQDRPEYAAAVLRQLGVQTFVCLPLIVSDQVMAPASARSAIGTLSLAHPDVIHLDPDLVPLAQSLTHVIATLVARHQAEAALRASRENLEALIEHTDGSIYSDAELAQLSYQDLTPTQWHAVEARIVQDEILPQGYSAVYEKEYRRKDGTIIPIELRTVLIRDAQGQPAGMWAIIRDITERRRAELLVATQRDLARLIATTTDPAVTWPRCLALAVQVCELDCGGLYLFDAEAQTLELVAHQGLSEGFVQAATRYPLDTAQAQWLLAGKAMYWSGADLQRRDIFRHETLACVAVMPIHAQGRILGCVNLGSHTLPEVPAFARHALETIGTEIGNVVVALRTAATLREREEQYRSLVESQESILATLDADGVFHFINGIGAAALSSTPAAIIGRRLRDLVPPAIAARQLQEIQRVLACGEGGVVEEQIPIAGSLRWTRTSIQPIRDATGTPVLALVNALDITERRQAEAQLQESQLRLEQAIAGANLGTWDWDVPTGRIVFNERWAEIIGYTLAELAPVSIQTWRDLCHPADLQRAEALLKRHFAHASDRYECELRMRHKSGAWTWVLTCGKVVAWDAAGAPVRMVGTHLDITARKQAELALRASEEHYHGLLESLDSVVVTVDAGGRFRYLNEVAAAFLGGTVAELSGRTMGELFPEPVAQEQLAVVQQVIREDRELVVEDLTMVQGQPRWYRSAIQPIHDDEGRVIYALVHTTDIHDLKTTQEQLRALNQTLEARVAERTAEVQDLYDHAPTGYYALDRDGQIINVNQTLLDWLGYTRAEVLGRPFLDLVPPTERSIFETGFPAFKEQGWLRARDGTLRRKNGSTFAVLLNATAVYDANGVYTSSRATVFDNTERRNAEDALRESEARLRLSEARLHLLLDKTPAVIFSSLAEPDFRSTFISESVRHVLGYTPAQFLGSPAFWASRIHPEDTARVFGDAPQLLAQGWRQYEYRCRHADGSYRWVESGVSLLPAAAGHPAEVVGYLIDITARKEAEELLRQANLELSRALKLKDEFLATMSHELRTPLNAILGFSENLQAAIYEPLTARQRGAIQHIETSGRHLLALINDILDLAKVEAGQLTLTHERIEIADVCQSSLLFVRELAHKKGIQLSFTQSEPLAIIEADPRRLKQLLINLLSNAVKFTPDGGHVSLAVTLDGEAGMARFAVRDTGIGIAPADQARLFQPFVQLDSSLSRQHAGTGLGLALVRRLAELHSGCVTLESAVGAGSCFTLILPLAPPTTAPEQPPSTLSAETRSSPRPSVVGAEPSREPGLVPARILLAEDNESNLQVTSDYLQARGFAVSVARTGKEALAVAVAQQPDLILMDIQLPELDGLAVIRQLRKLPPFAHTPILALTALAMPGDRERCLAAGANAYLTKPVRFQEQLAMIRQLLQR